MFSSTCHSATVPSFDGGWSLLTVACRYRNRQASAGDVFSATIVDPERAKVYSQNRSDRGIQVEPDLAEDETQNDRVSAVAGPQLLQAIPHVIVDRRGRHS